MTLEKEIKQCFKRIVFVSGLTSLVAATIMILFAPSEQGKAQALMMLFGIIIFGLITAALSSFYFLLKREKVLEETWKWKSCILIQFMIPLGTIPEVLKLIQEPFFLSANVVTLSWSVAVLIIGIWNYKRLNRSIKLMLT